MPSCTLIVVPLFGLYHAVADPDLELRWGGGGGLNLLALSAIFPSVISFFTQSKGGPGPSPRSATVMVLHISCDLGSTNLVKVPKKKCHKKSPIHRVTPPYIHPINMASSLLGPLYSGPNKSSVSHFLIQRTPYFK